MTLKHFIYKYYCPTELGKASETLFFCGEVVVIPEKRIKIILFNGLNRIFFSDRPEV